MYEQSEASKFWEAFGFEEQSTGGGCTAFEKKIQSGYIMVTGIGEHEAAMPTSTDEPVVVGFYPDVNESSYGTTFEFSDSESANAVIAQFVAFC